MAAVHHFTQLKLRHRAFRKHSGFTLAEVLIAAGILAFFACSSLIALTQLNRYAAISRLRTLAMAFAQQKVDATMTIPWGIATAPPTLLNTGAVTENNLPLDNDAFNAQAGLGSSFSGLDLQTTATRVTTITSITTRTRTVSVTVTYSYRGRTYNVSLTTLRATDTI